MKDKLRQTAVIATTLLTLIVNGLANALPLNGQTTGEISDRFQVYFVPAGYVFSIWGLIYIGLIAFTIFQALPSQRANPRLREARWWVVLANLANSAWIFLWHYEQFPLTMLVMLVLLASLIIVYLRLNSDRARVPMAETWAVRVPFRIYLGWITVATIANATTLLNYLGWDGFGLAPEFWMGIMLVAVLVITALMNSTRRDIAYTLVILWALIGIALKHASVDAVAIPTWITIGLVVLSAVAVFFIRRSGKRLEPAL
jgi:hypothetical protein